MKKMKKIKKDKKSKEKVEKKSWSSKKKIIYFLILFGIIIILILFGTKIYLAISLLIGNDSLVRLTSTNQDIFLNNSESKNIEFNIYVSTNPFCMSLCEYTFTDLSTGEIIDKSNFSTLIENPKTKKYNLQAPPKGIGQNLYRFWVSCTSKKSIFCETSEKPIKKSYVIALNYNLSENQSELKLIALEKINNLVNQYYKLRDLALENEYRYDFLSPIVLTEKIGKNDLSPFESQINESLENFRNYEYNNVINQDIIISNNSIEKDNLRLKVFSEEYNNFVLLTNIYYEYLTNLSLEKNMSERDIEKISLSIKEYNNFLESLKAIFNVENKTLEITKLIEDLNKSNLELNNSEPLEAKFEAIGFSDLKLINISYMPLNNNSDIILTDGAPLCPFEGVDELCCDDSCSKDPTKYPIILLHGYSFNNAISSEKSLSDLKELQEQLVNENFLDGGDLILKSTEGSRVFKKTQKRVVFIVSYYFDIYRNPEDSIILETRSDSLDTYALRLNEIIKEVKLITNKDKVVIVSHSMGGLVARKYLQIFGEENVEELIMIGTPNQGIEGSILSACSILGADNQCNDMDKKSLFINKLNYGKIPEISVKNIIGVGCNMETESGDGVVKNSSGYLSWADNYYIKGTCNGVKLLHSDLPEPSKYPEVYELIKSFLKKE